MKRRALLPETAMDSAETSLCRALSSLRGTAEVRAFLHDLCTPAELEALVDRWSVVPYILDGVPYREIHAHTAVSITTIGRVARCLAGKRGGYRKAVQRLAAARKAARP